MVRIAVAVAIVGFAAIGASGCSEPPGGESLAVIASPDVVTALRGATSAADEPPVGTATVEQILCFEDARLWHGTEAVRLSPVHSEGSFSLAVRPSSLAVVRSAAFAFAASTLRQLAIDLRVPASAGT